MKNMKIIEFGEWRFSESELKQLGPEFVAVISTIGFALNEIRVFQVLFLSTMNKEYHDEIVLQKSTIQQNVILRTMNAKIFEGRKCLSDSIKIVGRKGSANAKAAIQAVKSDAFGNDESLGYKVASKMRDKITNHYLPSETLKDLGSTPVYSSGRMIFHEADGNSFFPMGEESVFHAKLISLSEEFGVSTKEVLGAWLDWSLETSAAISEAMQKLLIAIVQDVFPEKTLRQRKPYVDPNVFLDAKTGQLPLFHNSDLGVEE